MQSTAPFSPQHIQGMTLNEAGKAELCQLAAKYPYFLPLKVLCRLLEDEAAAQQEFPYVYGVNPVVLHYLSAKLKETPAVPRAESPTIVGWQPAQPEATAAVEEKAAAVITTPEAAVPETIKELAGEKGTDFGNAALAGAEALVVADQETGAAAAHQPAEERPEAIAETAAEEAPAAEMTAAEPGAAGKAVEAEPAELETPEAAAAQEEAEAAPAATETPEEEALAVEAPSEAAQEPMIQPLYTKDYFKHQGVSVEEGENPFDAKKPSGNDLMVMRSFGEWLRFFHSKKVKATEEQEDKRALKAMWQKGKLAAALEEEDEEIPEVVFEMAVKSISHEGNPATETMAKIYLGQGKWEKAISVYEQLQLRNPQKSTYFAEKIAAIEQQHRP